MNANKTAVLGVLSLSMFGCSLHQPSLDSSIKIDAPEQVKISEVKNTSLPEPQLPQCNNTQRDLTLTWGDRTYWCGPVRRSNHLANINKVNKHKDAGDLSDTAPKSIPTIKTLKEYKTERSERRDQFQRETEELSNQLKNVSVVSDQNPKPKEPKVRPVISSIDKENAPKKKQSKYNYSVAYIYDATQPWNQMWDKLDDVNVTDKFRGTNTKQDNYYIYTGAYYKIEHAEVRQRDLEKRTGQSPIIRKRPGA